MNEKLYSVCSCCEGFPIYEGAVMLYLRATNRENYYGLFRVSGTVGQMVVSVLTGFALEQTVDPVTKYVHYWPAFVILFVLMNITAFLLYLYRLPRSMRPPRSLCARLRAQCCAPNENALSCADTRPLDADADAERGASSQPKEADQQIALTSSLPEIGVSDARGKVKRVRASGSSEQQQQQTKNARCDAGSQEVIASDVSDVSSVHQFIQAMKFAVSNVRVSVFLFYAFCTGLIYGTIPFLSGLLNCFHFLFLLCYHIFRTFRRILFLFYSYIVLRNYCLFEQFILEILK